jgi:hypothetical protein
LPTQNNELLITPRAECSGAQSLVKMEELLAVGKFRNEKPAGGSIPLLISKLALFTSMTFASLSHKHEPTPHLSSNVDLKKG